MAGGCIKRGFDYGKTDEFAYNVVEKPLHIRDLNATLLHCQGIDHQRFTFKHRGLDHRLTGVEEAHVAYSDPDVGWPLAPGGVSRTVEDTHGVIAAILRYYEEVGGLGPWAVVDVGSVRVIGDCGAYAGFGGTLRAGRHVKLSRSTPMTNLYLAMLDRMVANAEQVGDSTGTLDDV